MGGTWWEAETLGGQGGDAGRVRGIPGANQEWARLCGCGHMFSPGCEWLQSLCALLTRPGPPAWSPAPSSTTTPTHTPLLSWTLGYLTVSWVSVAFQKSFPRLRWMQRQGDGGPELLECRLPFPSSRCHSPGRFLSVLPPAKGRVGASITPGSSPFPRPPGWCSSPAPPERTNAGTCT